MDEDDDLNACRADQNHAEAFHHHGTSGGWPKASSGPRKSFCLMADQAQKIALHTTSALPPTTKTSPRITIAVSYFSRPSGENQTLQSPRKGARTLANCGFRGSIC